MLSFISRLQVKTQQGVPSQPSNLRSVESRATSITLAWEQPSHSGDNIVSYELYWNDTFSGDVSIIFPFFQKYIVQGVSYWNGYRNVSFWYESLWRQHCLIWTLLEWYLLRWCKHYFPFFSKIHSTGCLILKWLLKCFILIWVTLDTTLSQAFVIK